MTGHLAIDPSSHDSRGQRERAYHDRRYARDLRAGAHGFYAGSPSRSYYRARVAELGGRPGVDVLEYGCGTGTVAVGLASLGATVTGIDISSVAVEAARREAAAQEVDARFVEGDAHSLAIQDDSFDLVCGSGILHHLDLNTACTEVGRVLRPTGRAVFLEPLAHNPAINLYRTLTPRMRTPDERPLRIGDLESAGARFGESSVRYFQLLALAAIPFRHRREFPALMDRLAAADEALFRRVPPARRFAWTVVVELGAP